MITAQTIPAWFVGVMMILTGLMWLITKQRQIRMDSRIFAFTLIVEGLVYLVVYQTYDISTEVRGFVSRLMVVMLCLSQFIPLSISYVRSIKRGY